MDVKIDSHFIAVDVKIRENLRNNVKELNKQGVTIILTTHLMHEAQEMGCEHTLAKGAFVNQIRSLLHP